ncbi:MAG: class I SAM-dependent methyltransferase [Ignavibacteriae bacterium]|nr:class I SAM-dependent methyltransferase [Ignavibacteria bacterium]MBI3365294.1 class I SAM-dependent methyltransferase [Ignavibacteriota bacterium]
MLRDFFRRLKEGTEHLNYGRDVIADWAAEKLAHLNTPLSILDLGCGHGDDLINVRNSLSSKKIRLFGIEAYSENARDAGRAGIEVVNIDLERSAYPYPDNTFDLIIANQIIEHTKEIFWIFSECSRILKHNGYMIVGVPNLASLHNRILLLFGDQPSSIELLGPHVRGMTVNGFRRFVEADAIFHIDDVKGSNFYPFPASISRPFSKFFSRLSVSLFFLIRKTHPTKRFIEVLDTRFFETNFYTGR